MALDAEVVDFEIASLAAGFTICISIFTIWEAVRQTRQNSRPVRSLYIWMLWGEIVSNLIIGIVGFLFIQDAVPVSYVRSLLAYRVLR